MINMEKDTQNIPKHIGIIMDGNRRWAKERHLPSYEGHAKGYEKVKQLPRWFFTRGVSMVSVYAFSTENWDRSQEEVNYLMKLLKQAIDEEFEAAANNDYRVIISGRTEELPGDLPESVRQLMDATISKTNGILNICLNYGGRAEITDAVKKIVKNNPAPEQIHEGFVGKYLYNSDILTDPDIIVRTSGEMRLSGFMLWRSAYSELFFLKKHWTEFEEYDAIQILEEYAQRQRRFGGE